MPESQPKTRTVSPQDQAARTLAKVLGSSLGPCRKQVAALLAAGWTLERITGAVHAHGEPGIAPWDWTKKARAAVDAPVDPNAEMYAFFRASGQEHLIPTPKRAVAT